MNSRSSRLRGSLESSWGDAEYASDDGSIQSASDVGSEVNLDHSEDDVILEPEATPVLHSKPRRNRPQHLVTSTYSQLEGTSNKSPSAKKGTKNTQTPTTTVRSKRSARHRQQMHVDEQYEQDFIMPSIVYSPNGHADGSRLLKSQIRQRNLREPVLRDLPNSPRVKIWNPSRIDAPVTTSAPQEELGPWYYLNLFSEHVFLPLLSYFLNVFSYGMRHVVKPFLGLVLGIGILLLGLHFATGFLRSTISNALLAPVCLIPGSSYIIPSCGTTVEEHPQAKFEELINVQTQFEDILEASKDTSQLPSTIKNSEIAIRDLRVLVRYSQLPSRRTLDNEFEYFVQTAAEASQDLSRYNSRIGAAMDRVIATNTWTMAVLQGLEDKQSSIGTVGRVFNAMTGAFIPAAPTLQERIFDQYLLHVSKNKDEITGLVETAEALLKILQNLEERLSTIYAIAVNDDQTITRNQEELLSSLWTKLGANRNNVNQNQRQLNLLKNISAYRKRAVVHVSETLLKLQEIQAELENLREGVAAPSLLGYRGDVPLTHHLGLIEAGVKRLRAARGESMRVEGETYRNMMRGNQEGAGLKDLPGHKSMPVISVKSR